MSFKGFRRKKALLLSARVGVAVLLLLAIAGCGMFDRFPVYREFSPLPPGAICRVAVLPFLNDSDYPFGDAIVSKVFAAQFQAMGDQLVVQEGDVLKIYQQLHLLPGRAPSLAEYQIIGNRTNAQLMITGIILEMREDRGAHQTANPMLLLEVQIRDGSTGEILWTIMHRHQGSDYNKTMHFGTIHTMTGLSRQISMEIINLMYQKGLVQCNELS